MKMKVRKILYSAFIISMLFATTVILVGCGKKKNNKDSIVLMSEDVSGLFNPFYATSGADMEVTGMTQIGMLTTDSNGQTACGDDLPTVAKAYKQEAVGNED